MVRSLPTCLPWIFCLFLGIPPLGCSPKNTEDSTTDDDAIPVRVAQPILDEVIETVRAESTLQPLAQIHILAEQIGDVRELTVDVGDKVEENQILARIDNKDLQLQILQAKQTLQAQEKELKASEPLLEQGYLPRQAFDELRLTRDQSRTHLQRLQSTLGDQKIRAPFAGTVLERSIELGQKVTAGAALFEIADVSELRLRIPVPERTLRRLHVDQSATITLRALDDAKVDARVVKIFPSVDASTGTILVELALESTQLADGTPLRPGMYARAEIEVERRQDVLLVPRKALVEEGKESYLFVVEPTDSIPEPAADDAAATAKTARVQQRAVSTGWRGEGRVEILNNLDVKERVITLGQNRLREGSQVRVVETEE